MCILVEPFLTLVSVVLVEHVRGAGGLVGEVAGAAEPLAALERAPGARNGVLQPSGGELGLGAVAFRDQAS